MWFSSRNEKNNNNLGFELIVNFTRFNVIMRLSKSKFYLWLYYKKYERENREVIFLVYSILLRLHLDYYVQL